MSARNKGIVQKFLDYAKPDNLGWTEAVLIEDLNAHYNSTEFSTTNGGSWCRSDAPALSRYNVERIKGPAVNEHGKKVMRIVAVQLKGFRETDANKGIRDDIREVIKLRKCVVLLTANDVQVDHKSPRLATTPHVLRNETQGIDDFQALCRAANSAKRGHCKDCENSGKRFDARKLGYSVAQWLGTEKFSGNCVGCYWYDPVQFNREVSAGFEARRELR